MIDPCLIYRNDKNYFYANFFNILTLEDFELGIFSQNTYNNNNYVNF